MLEYFPKQDTKDKIYILGTQIDTMNSRKDWNIKKSWIALLKKKYFENKQIATSHLLGVPVHMSILRLNLQEKVEIDRKDILSLCQLKGNFH